MSCLELVSLSEETEIGFKEAKTTRICRHNTGKRQPQREREERPERGREGVGEEGGKMLALEICIKVSLRLWLSIHLYMSERNFLENTRLNSTWSSKRAGNNLCFHQKE